MLKEIAGWFQPTYNKIDEWDWPELRALLGNIWEKASPDLKKAIYNLITVLVKKYGEPKAREIIQRVSERLPS